MNNQTKSTLQVAIETLLLAESKHPIEKYLQATTLEEYLIYRLSIQNRLSSAILARKHMDEDQLKIVYREDRADRVIHLYNKNELMKNNFILSKEEIKAYSDFKNTFDLTNFMIANNIENTSLTSSDIKSKMFFDYLEKRTNDRLSLLLNPEDENDDSIDDVKLKHFGILSQLTNDPNSPQPARNKAVRAIGETEVRYINSIFQKETKMNAEQTTQATELNTEESVYKLDDEDQNVIKLIQSQFKETSGFILTKDQAMKFIFKQIQNQLPAQPQRSSQQPPRFSVPN